MPAVTGRAFPSASQRAVALMEKDERPELPAVDSAMASMAAAVRTSQQQATTIYYPQHRQWAINHALYIGNQYASWSDQVRRMVQAENVPKHRVRIVVNVILPVVQTMVSMLLKTRPEATVVPATQEVSDKNAARAAERILDFVNQDLRLRQLRLQTAIVMLCKASAFWKIIWNPESGPVLPAVDDESGQPLVDPETGAHMTEDGSPEGAPLTYQPGRIEVELCYPESILPDPQARSWDEITWLVHTRRRSLLWIRDRFHEWGKFISNERDEDFGTIESQLNNLTASSTLTSGLAPGTPTEGARVNEMWLKPGAYFNGKRFPKGAVITQCQGYSDVKPIEYLSAKGAQPDRDWHPFVMWRCYESGRFWPIGVPDNLGPIQREINRITSNLIEAQRLTSRPKIIIPNSCAISSSAFTSEPGEKVRYNHLGGGKPEVMAFPNMPAFVGELLGFMKENIDFVSNQHGPSRGQNPTNVRSGIGISLLQEQDATDLGPLTTNWEDTEERAARQILLRANQYWEIERTVSVVGADKQIESMSFKGADIGHNVDVRVQAGSGLPKSKAAQQALAQSLIEMGLMSPMIPKQRQTLLQMMELGIGDDYGRTEDQDRRWAEAENELLRKGMQSKVQWYENHTVHIESHIQAMKGDEYRQAVAQNPMVEAIFNLHLAMHTQDMMMATVGANPASGPMTPGAQMLMGGPGGAPGPGQQQQQTDPSGKPIGNGPGRMPGMGGVQDQQANREQSMGNGENAEE